jgi:protein-tyrosine phosphatase
VIDTHCHLLPGLDDGPALEAEALLLARDLIGDGIDFVVCTPHLSHLFAPSHAEVVERFESLRVAVTAAGLRLRMSAAAEVSAGYALSEPLLALRQRAVGDRYVIVELHPDTPGSFLPACRDRLAEAHLLPIFAHPERCRAVQRDPALLDDLAGDGALAQIVAPSLLGRWGRAVGQTAWELLASGRVDLVGSDAHGVKARRCHMREAAELIERSFGADVRRELTERGPSSLVAGGVRPSTTQTSARSEPVE